MRKKIYSLLFLFCIVLCATVVIADTKDINAELKKIVEDNKKKHEQDINIESFVQPSDISKEDLEKLNSVLTEAERQQLIILWRATLERNKTIQFIVEKLTPESDQKKKTRILSQVLNTAIFLPFYALQSAAPGNASMIASTMGAGLTSDIMNNKSKKEKNKIMLSQTEMVVSFMMIDQVAERVRTQYYNYKQEKIDSLLLQKELEEARLEAAASLDVNSKEAQFLSQIRLRQLERENRRINARLRTNRLALIDLSGIEAVDQVDELINKEASVIYHL